jgi:hypothetical protein
MTSSKPEAAKHEGNSFEGLKEALQEIIVIANIGHICFLYRCILRRATGTI